MEKIQVRHHMHTPATLSSTAKANIQWFSHMAARHVDTVKMICWSSNTESGRGSDFERSVTVSSRRAGLNISKRKKKKLIYWDFMQNHLWDSQRRVWKRGSFQWAAAVWMKMSRLRNVSSTFLNLWHQEPTLSQHGVPNKVASECIMTV